MGAKTTPKSIPKRGRNLRAKKSPLGIDLGRFWVVLGGVRGGFLLILYWFLYHFVEIDVFDVKTAPRRVLVAVFRNWTVLPYVRLDLGLSRLGAGGWSAAEAWALQCTFRTEVQKISKKSNVTFFE